MAIRHLNEQGLKIDDLDTDDLMESVSVKLEGDGQIEIDLDKLQQAIEAR